MVTLPSYCISQKVLENLHNYVIHQLYCFFLLFLHAESMSLHVSYHF